MNQSVIITLNSPITASYGPTFSITADVGTVTPGYATLTQLLSGFVASVNVLATEFTITPVFSDCPPIVVTIESTSCNCYTLYTSGGVYTVTWTDCDGVEQSENFSDKKTLYCSQTLPILTGIGGTPTVTQVGTCIDGDCVVPCNCITLVNTAESTSYYSYIGCSGIYYENVPLAFGTTTQVCGTFVSADVDINHTTGDPCINMGGVIGFVCPGYSPCSCVYFSAPLGSAGGSFSYTDCNGVYHDKVSVNDGESFNICVDVNEGISVLEDVDYLEVGACTFGGETLSCNVYLYNCFTVSQTGDGITFQYIDFNGIIQTEIITGGAVLNICTFVESIQQVAGIGTMVVSAPGASCTSDGECNP